MILTVGRTWVSALVDLILPDLCAACGCNDIAADGLCEDCAKVLLQLVGIPYCPRCGASQGPNIPIRSDGCWACSTVLGRMSQVVRLGPYSGPLRKMIHELKYRNHRGMLRYLAGLLAEAFTARCPQISPDLVIPVPMHWARRISRGYNHSEALACALGAELGLPLGNELVRLRHTPQQTTLSRTSRRENVRGAFGVVRKSNLHGASILLVDDVTTTGATADESTKALLDAGASNVYLAVIAKAEPPRAYASQWL